MAIRSVHDLAVTEFMKVLVRVDYNVDLDLLKSTGEHFKISASRETVDALLAKKAKVALATHIGEPDGKDPRLSSERLIFAAEKALGRKVRFVPECIGETVSQVLETLEPDTVLLLENVRFHREETANDPEFAKKLAEPFAAYVNEAFGVCHRKHASVAAVTKCLPSTAGLRLLRELSELDRVRLRPEHPAVAIIGGAKISTKLPLIQSLELNYDAILVGGKIANEALDTGVLFSESVELPSDFDSPERFDIGQATIDRYTDIIENAKTIVWNGPMGKFEDPLHRRGTEEIFAAVLRSSAFTVMGGGESLDIIEKNHSHDNIDFVSTGGGAMLEYLSGTPLAALVSLDRARTA